MDSGFGHEVAKAQGLALIVFGVACVAGGGFVFWLLQLAWTHLSITLT